MEHYSDKGMGELEQAKLDLIDEQEKNERLEKDISELKTQLKETKKEAQNSEQLTQL